MDREKVNKYEGRKLRGAEGEESLRVRSKGSGLAGAHFWCDKKSAKRVKRILFHKLTNRISAAPFSTICIYWRFHIGIANREPQYQTF